MSDLLARDDINANLQDKNDATALSLAFSDGLDIELQSLLMEHEDVDLTLDGEGGRASMFLACGNNYLDGVLRIANLLDTDETADEYNTNTLEDICNSKSLCNSPGMFLGLNLTPLQMACIKHNPDIVDVLLAMPGIDVNAPWPGNNTTLHFVCQSAFRVEATALHKDTELLENALDIINTLLKNPNTNKFEMNNECKMPFNILTDVYTLEEILWHVCELGCNHVLLWLIENVKKSEQAFQAFIAACNQRQMREDLNLVLTPLQLACVKGNVDMVSSLLTIPHIDVNAPLPEIRLSTLSLMFNVLTADVDHAHIVDIINLLLQHEYTDVNIVDANQRTALMYAMNSDFIP